MSYTDMAPREGSDTQQGETECLTPPPFEGQCSWNLSDGLEGP